MPIGLLEEMHSIRTIISMNSHVEADNLDDSLYSLKPPVPSIHSDHTRQGCEAAMRGSRLATPPVLLLLESALEALMFATSRMSSTTICLRLIEAVLKSILIGLVSLHPIMITTHEPNRTPGRTNRPGHRGIAISLYPERDEPLARVLTGRYIFQLRLQRPSGYTAGRGMGIRTYLCLCLYSLSLSAW